MLHPLLKLTWILLPLVSNFSHAAEKHHNHTAGMNHNAMTSSEAQPTQGGQAAFAAIIEIVELLEQNPNTNWDNVDIDGLRSHLRDMNQLMQNTEASKEIITEAKIRFTITGNKDSIAAIHRMVPVHSRFIQTARGWTIEAMLNDKGANLTVSSDNPEAIKRLNALGFYGFMSLESHHQAHHYQMAQGHSH